MAKVGIAERREREKERRRSDIIDAAEDVFFSKSVALATMDDIAETAELSKGTLYLYFKSKEDLYLAIVLRGISILQQMLADASDSHRGGREKIKAIGRAYFDFYKTHPDYFHAMLYFEACYAESCEGSNYGAECMVQSAKTFEICARALQVGIDDGTVRADLDPMKTALTLYGLSTGLLQVVSLKGKMIQENHQLDPDELIETFFTLIDTSLRAPDE
jgi:AcrR family transcriptional regulator